MVIRKSLKKKDQALLTLKTDSYVVESNVHFPTDYNLLWDSARKCLDIIEWFKIKHPNIEQWRNIKEWHSSLKNLCRALGQSNSGAGKNKVNRVIIATKNYLKKSESLIIKLKKTRKSLPQTSDIELLKKMELDAFIILMEKHIDLLERRVLKGEKIPHQEKLFSIFEQYTEWIIKGKQRPSFELGKKLSITTDQYGLIVDYYIMNNESDSEIVIETIRRVNERYFGIESWSFDKGYWHKDNKAYLKKMFITPIMPKKGKCNKEESQKEHTKEFKKLRNKHSAIESNINELEQCGLERCPDKGYHGFERYIGMGITAYNLKRIGRQELREEKELLKKVKRKVA